MTPSMSLRLAELAYLDAENLSCALPPEVQNVQFIEHEDTQLFIGDLPNDECVIAFRGTTDIADWLTNLDVKMTEHTESGGKIHHGFARALTGVWTDIHAEIMRRDPDAIHLIGHSLGGALATVCAARLAAINQPDIALTTFGCPRVGNRRFVRWLLPRIDLSIRYVNRADVVPRVPAFGFRFKGWRPQWCGLYRQLGPMEFTDGERWYHDPPLLYVEAVRMRAYWQDLGIPGIVGRKDHQIPEYREALMS